MGSTDSPRLQVAICGAGIAGLTAAIALRKQHNIEVQIYEKASELKEIGASIALGPSGLRTLERLGLENAIRDEIAYRGPSNIPMIYRHWKTDEVLGLDYHGNVTEYLHRTARYLRAHLQEALLEHVPKEIIHLGKRFTGAEVDSDGVSMRFEDGTTVRADILVGADGLRSGVRQYFAPELKLKWSGWTAFRAVFDYSFVEDIPNVPQDSTHWWGPDTNFFASRLGKNIFTVVGGVQADPSNPRASYGDVEWDQKANVKLLREIYRDWNPVVKALSEATPDIRYYPNLAVGESLESWVFHDRITLIGDAAHAHGGAFATGGSLAIDDAYALYLAITSMFSTTVTSQPTTPTQLISKALHLYEKTRKPHADKLLGIVHKANANKATNIGTSLTDNSLRNRAANRPDTVWLHEHDVVQAFHDISRERSNI